MNSVKRFTMISAAVAVAAAMASAMPATAQDSSYVPGTVWQFTNIKVEPGQFENYLDYLSHNYKHQMELGKQMDEVVSYHVFAVNNPRKDEPDLVLATEYKDYFPVSQQLAMQKKLLAALASDPHKIEAESGGRAKMRTEVGGMELQELKLK